MHEFESSTELGGMDFSKLREFLVLKMARIAFDGEPAAHPDFLTYTLLLNSHHHQPLDERLARLFMLTHQVEAYVALPAKQPQQSTEFYIDVRMPLPHNNGHILSLNIRYGIDSSDLKQAVLKAHSRSCRNN